MKTISDNAERDMKLEWDRRMDEVHDIIKSISDGTRMYPKWVAQELINRLNKDYIT